MSAFVWSPPSHVVTESQFDQEFSSAAAGAVADAERRHFDTLVGRDGLPIVLFGAGNLGRRILAGLRHVGVEPVGFCDNSPDRQGTCIDGLHVFAPADGVANFGPRVAYVVSIWTPYGRLAYPTVNLQLRALGAKIVVPFAPLMWKFAEVFLPNFCLDLPFRLYRAAGDVKAGYELLQDDSSRNNFRTQLRYLLSAMDTIEVAGAEDMESYFTSGPAELGDAEFLVDCGAYDGDTIASFLSISGGNFERIVAFEPDAIAAARLTRFVSGLAPSVRRRIQVEIAAVAREKGQARFVGGGTETSRLSGEGDTTVWSTALDEALDGTHPTFVKMDIEGAEDEALTGAESTIQRARPVLAICTYHVQQHLFRIPLHIAAIDRAYRIYLRRRGPDRDLVCFAVPPERATARGSDAHVNR